MKTLKVIGNVCLVFLAIISVVVSCGYLYFHFFVKTTTTGTNYVDNQIPIDLMEKVDDLNEDQIAYYESRYLFDVNYYSNDKDNGIEIQELQLNYFTDTSLNLASARSTGMQYIGEFQSYTVEVQDKSEADDYVYSDFTYYDTTDMISWVGGNLATILNRNTKLTIKIDDRPFLIQLTGSYRDWIYKSKTNLGRWLGFDHYIDHYFTYADVFYDVMNAVKTNSKGYGDYYIVLNLSNYFTVYEYDQDLKVWKSDNITDDIFTYAVCKFHYDENGLASSKQSFFKRIGLNEKYEEGVVDTEYTQASMIYTLTNDNFDYRFSDVYDGYFISLNFETKNLFKNMPRTKVFVNIDINSSDKKIVGIDYNAFENFEIETLTILGNNQTFSILDKGLFNTKLKTLKYSKSLNLELSENAINSDYKVVQL